MPQTAFRLLFRYYARFATWLCAFKICVIAAAGEPSTRFNFNGPGTTWEIDEKDRVGRVVSQECKKGGARDDGGFERMVVRAPAGESVQLICPTAPVAVMEELAVRMWVKASRPDIQLAARVALPRTVRDGSPKAIHVTVRGERYVRAGQWRQLVLNDVPKQLETEVRILRSASEVEIDSREAFIDAVVLIIPGDRQGVELATDELVVDGVVRNVSEEIRRTSYPAPVGGPNAATAAPRSVPASLRRVPNPVESMIPTSDKTSVRLHGDLLLVDERPFLPRAIEYRGEPLQALADRGFNVAWLDRVPTSEEAATAKKLGLWFIGVPSHPETLMRERLGRPDDRVIAWLLNDQAMESDPSYASRWAELVRERDAVAGRPVVIAPHENWNLASKNANVLLAARPRLGCLPIDEYEDWLTRRIPLIQPGMPLWVSFPSQFGPAAGRQVSVLSGGTTTASPNVASTQIQSLVDVACIQGMRGFAFRSDSALSETDAATRARATDLELINRRLARLEPWLASGKVFGRFPSADASWMGVVLSVDRARLLIPVASKAARESASARGRDDVTFVIPGIPESCQVFVFTPVAFKTLAVQRVAGGSRFALRPVEDTFVLMTEDPKVVHSLRQHISQNGRRVVGLLRESAALKTAAISNAARRLTQSGVNGHSAAQTAASAASLLQQVDSARSSHRVEQAYEAAVAANRALDQAAVELRRSVISPRTLCSNPLALGDDYLAELGAFEKARPTHQFGDNLLYGGDFEDVGQLTQMGWRHFQNPEARVQSHVELSVVEPRHGSYCLLLRAAAASGGRLATDVASVWIESPPMPVTAGQIVEITGWARVERQAGDDSDGLEIIDSAGGPDLALAIRQTNGWERFHMIRAIPDAAELRLIFSLSGLGTAQLDAIMVRPVQRPSAPQPPLLSPANGTSTSSAPATAGPLFVAPSGTPR